MQGVNFRRNNQLHNYDVISAMTTADVQKGDLEDREQCASNISQKVYGENSKVIFGKQKFKMSIEAVN